MSKKGGEISFLLYSLLLVLFFNLVSCSGTRHLTENEKLYVGSRLKIRKDRKNKFKIKDGNKKLLDAYLTVWDVPNGAILETPFLRFIPQKLLIYNLFYNEKDEGFAHWMRENFGEEPVLFSDINPDLKIKKVVESYENYGHFGTKADYKLKYRKKGKKVFIKYYVEIAPSYHYRKIWFEMDSTKKDSINRDIEQYMEDFSIKEGDEFNLYKLKEEKKNIWTYLQNNGYYYIFEDDIIIEADTAVGHREIDLRFRLNNYLTPIERSKVKVEEINITIDSVTKKLTEIDKFIYKRGFLKGFFIDSLTTIDTSYFSLAKTIQSGNFYSKTGILQKQQIKYRVNPTDSLKLIANISLTPAKATRLGFNINGDFRSAGFLGPSVEVRMKQLNLFGKAQNLDVKTNFFYYFPIGLYNKKASEEFGVSIKATYKAPAISTFMRWPRTEESMPMYHIKTNIDLLKRKNFYTQNSLNGAYGVSWNTRKFDAHNLDFINVTLSNIYSTTARYDSILAGNNSLRQSLVNQFLASIIYTYKIDRRKNRNWPRGLFFETKLESAGTILNLLNSVFTNQPSGDKKVFGIRFAQFVQLYSDFRYLWDFSPVQTLAFKVSGGVGVPFGNNTTLPYIRQYFIGGTNSLRPFSSKVLGPGRYVEFDSDAINQVGDVKFEANIEYRFKLGIRLSGAIWADGGNIWLLKEDPLRPGSGIRWGKIVEDSYLTSGVGLRLDLNFIILRYDYGVLLYAPIFIDGKKWVFQNKIFAGSSTIGIGFPF